MLPAPDTLTPENGLLATAPGLDQSLRIGLPSIDDEHQALFAQLDVLANNRQAQPDGEVFSLVLVRLGEQIRGHFDNEEKILHSIGMVGDEISQHVFAHDEILEEYAQLNIDLMQGKALARCAVLESIRNWIIDHVRSHDLKIRKYLRRN